MMDVAPCIEAIAYLVKAPSLVEYIDDNDATIVTRGHHIFRVKIEGDWFAFDVAGAQFGSQSPVTPWHEYEAEMIREVINIMPFRLTSVSAYYRYREIATGFEPGIHRSPKMLIRFLDWVVLDTVGSFSSRNYPEVSLEELVSMSAAQYMISAPAYQEEFKKALRKIISKAKIQGELVNAVENLLRVQGPPQWQTGPNAFRP